MIIGTGIDILEIARIQKIASDAFCKKMFTDREMEYLSKKGPESMTGYFCAKEAVSKALGKGFVGYKFTDIEIYKDLHGCPQTALHGDALELAKKMGIDKIHVSISHSKIHATATAIAERLERTDSLTCLSSRKEIYPLNVLRKRVVDSHKGNYGRVHILGGCHEMSGAVILCANAALRSGAGLVTCVVPESIIDRVGANVIEATFMSCSEKKGFIKPSDMQLCEIMEKTNVLALGVGLGRNPFVLEKMSYILKKCEKPMVIDADGINLLSELKEDLKNAKAKIVLTPHLGEMARLTGNSMEEISKDRKQVAMEFARNYNVVLLLKGSSTVITDGIRIYENTTGNPGMATGGSGDVLTGIIASLIGQGYDVYDAASLGAFIHGAAGDAAYQKYGYGLTAGDLVDNLGFFLRGE